MKRDRNAMSPWGRSKRTRVCLQTCVSCDTRAFCTRGRFERTHGGREPTPHPNQRPSSHCPHHTHPFAPNVKANRSGAKSHNATTHYRLPSLPRRHNIPYHRKLTSQNGCACGCGVCVVCVVFVDFELQLGMIICAAHK